MFAAGMLYTLLCFYVVLCSCDGMMYGRVASPAHASMFAAGMFYTLLCFYVVILPSILAC